MNGFGDAGMQALCDGLDRGAAPSLRFLGLSMNNFGPAGAEALAAALSRGAMPKLERLLLDHNPIGNQGVAALAAPLRKMPALTELALYSCEINDEGVASLVDHLGKDDFKALKRLALDGNEITDVGCAKLVAALSAGALPAIEEFVRGPYPDDEDVQVLSERASEEALAAVESALRTRRDMAELVRDWSRYFASTSIEQRDADYALMVPEQQIFAYRFEQQWLERKGGMTVGEAFRAFELQELINAAETYDMDMSEGSRAKMEAALRGMHERAAQRREEPARLEWFAYFAATTPQQRIEDLARMGPEQQQTADYFLPLFEAGGSLRQQFEARQQLDAARLNAAIDAFCVQESLIRREAAMGGMTVEEVLFGIHDGDDLAVLGWSTPAVPKSFEADH